MTDWLDATDPVPARTKSEITDEQRARRLRTWKHRRGYLREINKASVSAHVVEPDFDDMGA